ncbi:MAG: hypothetical protein LKJ81_04865 [Bacilli bacterium]|jgi:hypothetical protein|nr:hypothetical protein [Bacilli bacterium]MCH4277385.1 hypothetical protein [Bacilli bacterium]MCI2055457.1 hypothetical protein [Bacilli bacterium]
MDSQAKEPLTEEQRKSLSRSRIFWAIVILDVVIACLFVYEMIDLFVR